MLKLTVVIALLAGGWYWAVHNSFDLAGAMPFTHVGIPYGFKLEDVGDQSGKVFVVTGANSGLGKSTVKILGNAGGTVYMACRSMKKCDAAKAELAANVTKGKGTLETLALDLGSFASVRAFAAAFLKKESRLDSLILNAGYMPEDLIKGEDGYEASFTTNHLSGFLLEQLLEPLLVKSAPSSVVAVSSAAQNLVGSRFPYGLPTTKAELGSLMDADMYDGFEFYGFGKLANVLFASELDRRLWSKGVSAVSVHPGGVRTEFLVNAYKNEEKMTLAGKVFKGITTASNSLFWSSDEAALTQVGAALNFDFHGKYLVPIARPMLPCSAGRNVTTARALWKLSEEVTSSAK